MDPDTPATDDADEAEARDQAGRYMPGVSGNPKGRPPGSRRILGLARVLAEAGVVAVLMVDPRRSARPSTSRRLRRPAP